jgi:hypothetical protein
VSCLSVLRQVCRLELRNVPRYAVGGDIDPVDAAGARSAERDRRRCEPTG